MKIIRYKLVEKQASTGFVLILVISVVFVFICGCIDSSNSINQLVIPGTGACQEILRELATAFNTENPNYEVTIPDSVGSGGGIESVGNDENILGRVARVVKESEEGYGLTYLAFAKDRVVFAVSGNVEIDNLTTVQIIDIFSGVIVNWNETGGQDANINVFVREDGDSSLEIINDYITAFESITFADNAMIYYHDYEMKNALETYSNCIGWITGSSLIGDTTIKAIALDDVEPTTENVLSGEYELTGEYAFVYKESKLDAASNAFIDFVFSDAGKQILEDTGLIALNK